MLADPDPELNNKEILALRFLKAVKVRFKAFENEMHVLGGIQINFFHLYRIIG